MLCVSLAFTFPLLSQEITKEEITEGREYWFGLQHCNREAGEAARGAYPIAIWISSKVDTKATVFDAETGSIKTYVIRANQITEVPYWDLLMMNVSEVVKKYGIHVTADDPVSVAVYMSYRWSGEAFRVTPAEWLGKKYVSLNLYQDQTDKLLPAQILIVSTDDNNVVKYRPTANTVKYDAGKLGQVTLQKGDCYLIEGRTNKDSTQKIGSDLTGTYIESTKPIAVISGHTKSAFPKIPFTFLGRATNFTKNLMVDMMLSIDLLGTEYVSAPLKYAARPRGVMPDDAGDMIRFVAAYDSTEISQLRKDGSGFMKISRVLKRGEWHEITNQEIAAYYRSNKPVLVGQYGKVWLDHVPTPKAEKENVDVPQNPSSNGQGMLIALTPINHFTSYSAFRSPASIDNYIYMTFDSTYLDRITFDGEKISTKFSSSIKYIKGTPYAWLANAISPGDHVIKGDTIKGGKNKAKFAGYAYGNWDRSKDGFAYGYPIGFNYNSICEDSLNVKDNMACGDANAQVFVTPPTADCAGLLNIKYKSSESTNYYFSTNQINVGDKNAQYFLNVIDIQKPANGIVTIVTRSGNILTKKYEYTPEQIVVQQDSIDFGLIRVGQKICKYISIFNPTTIKITVKNLRLKHQKAEFSITTKDILPIEIEPGMSKEIEVCATALVHQSIPISDSVIADLNCYSKNIAYLEFKTGEPIVTISDAMWVDIPVGTEVPRTVNIINKSNMNVELYSMDWADKVHFPRVEGLTFPLIIKPQEQSDFTVYYKPDKIGVQDKTKAIFTANTDQVKLYSDWVGNGIKPVSVEPLDFELDLTNGLLKINNNFIMNDTDKNIQIYSILGIKLMDCEFQEKIDISTLPAGLYFVRVGNRVNKFLKI